MGVVESDMACDFEARHIGFGKASFIAEEMEKIRILDSIVERLTDKKFASQLSGSAPRSACPLQPASTQTQSVPQKTSSS